MLKVDARMAQAPPQPGAVRLPARVAPLPATTGGRAGRVVRDDWLGSVLARAVARRQSALLQRYVEYTDSDGDAMRASDDLTMLTGVGYPNHLMWAKAGKADGANLKLAAVGSGVELEEVADDSYDNVIPLKSGKRVVLKRVIPRNLQNDTAGDDMLLYADCGRSASVIVGGSDRRAMYALKADAAPTDHIDDNNPSLMKIGIMRNWLKDQIASAGEGVDTSKLQAALSAGDSLDVELAILNAEKKTWTKATKKSVRDAWSVTYRRKLKQVAEAYFAYYNGLAQKDRDEVARGLEIDEYARPDVGQGFTTSSGGANIKGKSTWNFHWGGVVLTSDDNRDRVVLENYSVSKYDEENTNWTFDMYGTKTREQTFHGRHKATGQHGETPTTMVIEKRP